MPSDVELPSLPTKRSSEASSQDICVIIINYNAGHERLTRCLQSLAAQARAADEIIVYDNASRDGSTAAVETFANVRLIMSDENRGFAGGVNAAACETDAHWLVLLNPDATAEPDWLAQLEKGVRNYPQARSFASVQLDAANPEMLDGLGDFYHPLGVAWRGGFGKPATLRPGEDKYVFAACGAALMVHRETFLSLGGFAQDFFCYHEDVDLGARLNLAGHRTILLGEAVIHHEGSGTTGRYSPFTVYHGNRNRVRTFIRVMPALLFWPLLPLHFLLDMAFVARAYMIGTGPHCLRGVMDGFFRSPETWRQRRDIQKIDKISILDFMKRLTWSPFTLLKRAPDLREIN